MEKVPSVLYPPLQVSSKVISISINSLISSLVSSVIKGFFLIGRILTGYGPCLRLIFVSAVLLAASFTLRHLRPSHTHSTHLHHSIHLHSFPLDPFIQITPFFATSPHTPPTPCPLRETRKPPLFQLSQAKTIVYGLMIWRPGFSSMVSGG